MVETEPVHDELIHELKIRRLVENQHRLNLGMSIAFPLMWALAEGLATLLGNRVHTFMIWFIGVWLVAMLACMPFMHSWTESTVRRQLGSSHRHSKRVVRWLDRPFAAPRLYAMLLLAIWLFVLLLSLSTGSFFVAPGMILSYFAPGLIWGGLRWRFGDDLVCARCEYSKTTESEHTCPECGSAWIIADALALGRARAVPWMITVGALGVALNLTLLALIA